MPTLSKGKLQERCLPVPNKSLAGRALIVDEDDSFRELLTQLLLQIGIKAVGACSLEEARLTFNHEQFDVVITDILLSNNNGLAMIHFVKAANQSLPVIAMATPKHENEGFLSIALLQGADAVLSKPFSYNQLTTTLTQLLTAKLNTSSTDKQDLTDQALIIN